ncbi:MAG: hypothetical protein WA705_25635 [Candidatus Ozemobacteraceae bacterium]
MTTYIAKRRISFQQTLGWTCSFPILCVAAFFFLFSPSLNACDDSLVAILMAENPNEKFVGQVSRITASVKSLGELVNRGDYQKSRERLNDLMQIWIEFDNGYLVQPPFEVDDISTWRRQSAQIADRIGTIRRKFRDNQFDKVHPDLDFLVTDLTNLYARKAAQNPLFQTLIKLDSLAAAINPANDGGTGIASSAIEFIQTLGEWKSFDSSPNFQKEFAALRENVEKLGKTLPQNVMQRNELCQSVRSGYEALKRRFVLPNFTHASPPE